MLLAAATETGLLTKLENALPTSVTPAHPPLAGSSAVVRRRLLLTLLFLGAVGLHRTWDLRGYTGDGLARLSGRKRAYGYRYIEAFLSQVAHANGAESLTDTLAQWTTLLWHPAPNSSEQPESLTCYIDGHRKPVYSDVLIPRGLVGRLATILVQVPETSCARERAPHPRSRIGTLVPIAQQVFGACTRLPSSGAVTR